MTLLVICVVATLAGASLVAGVVLELADKGDSSTSSVLRDVLLTSLGILASVAGGYGLGRTSATSGPAPQPRPPATAPPPPPTVPPR